MENQFGNRIKTLRQHYDLAVLDFALGCGMSHPAIHHYEAGKVNKPQIKAMVKIAKAYNTTVKWLLTGEGEMLNNGENAGPGNLSEGSAAKYEAYEQIKSRSLFLEQEVERLWQMITYLTSKAAAENKTAVTERPKSYSVSGSSIY